MNKQCENNQKIAEIMSWIISEHHLRIGPNTATMLCQQIDHPAENSDPTSEKHAIDGTMSEGNSLFCEVKGRDRSLKLPHSIDIDLPHLRESVAFADDRSAGKVEPGFMAQCDEILQNNADMETAQNEVVAMLADRLEREIQRLNPGPGSRRYFRRLRDY